MLTLSLILGLSFKIALANTSGVGNENLIQAGIAYSIQQNHNEAIAIFKQIEKDYPNEPAGFFFHAAALQARMMDFEKYADEKHFMSLLNTAIEKATKQIHANKENAEAFFYFGSSYTYLAFYKLKEKKYLNAFQATSKGIEALEVAVAKDTTLYDAYLGIGTYKYYRSYHGRRFAWLPFFDDEREGGIAMIRLALEKGRFSRFNAMNSLCWILIEEERYSEALEVIKPALAAFPDSRLFMWCAAKLNKKLERWQTAAKYYEQILKSFRNEGISSPYNELLCRKNLAFIYSKMDEFEKAAEQCELASLIKLNSDERKRGRDMLDEITRICEETTKRTWTLR